MVKAYISNGEQHFGGGLWADVVSVQKDSRLPLFWSFHKNSLIDKYFQCFNKIRLEEDPKYAKIAQLKRHLTCVCISNCGSFLFSGYNDGWLIKNFVENGQFVRKFKYNDSIKMFGKNHQIHQIFLDNINSFVIVVKNNSIEKLDFFSGEQLAVLRLNDFYKETQINLKESQIKCDQLNNLIVIVTPCDRILIINWNNMTIVRSFGMVNQKQVSCLTIAQNAKKIIIGSQDKKLGIYDIFSAQQVSCFQLDKTLKTIDIREDIWLLAGASENQRSINLWKIDNLDWKVPKMINLPFQSQLIQMGKDLREHYFQNELNSATETQKFQSKKIIFA
jgi:WD40 repeat protein